eukprot:COSAG06_NODE_889_length_11746_cov_48.163733_15_plen_164_part_00
MARRFQSQIITCAWCARPHTRQSAGGRVMAVVQLRVPWAPRPAPSSQPRPRSICARNNAMQHIMARNDIVIIMYTTRARAHSWVRPMHGSTSTRCSRMKAKQLLHRCEGGGGGGGESVHLKSFVLCAQGGADIVLTTRAAANIHTQTTQTTETRVDADTGRQT